MKTLLIILLAGSFFYGCNKTSDAEAGVCVPLPFYEVEYLKATVQQTRDISCYKPVLDFTEDSVKIYNFTNSRSLRYNVTNLPANLNVVNNKLYVQIAVLKPAEYYPCNTLGVPYPALNVTDAKVRN